MLNALRTTLCIKLCFDLVETRFHSNKIKTNLTLKYEFSIFHSSLNQCYSEVIEVPLSFWQSYNMKLIQFSHKKSSPISTDHQTECTIAFLMTAKSSPSVLVEYKCGNLSDIISENPGHELVIKAKLKIQLFVFLINKHPGG